jgi:hypothetical protein
VTFAFVCVDKGSARAEIFDLLIRMGIPFIEAAQIRDMQLAELADHPDDVYRCVYRKPTYTRT